MMPPDFSAPIKSLKALLISISIGAIILTVIIALVFWGHGEKQKNREAADYRAYLQGVLDCQNGKVKAVPSEIKIKVDTTWAVKRND